MSERQAEHQTVLDDAWASVVGGMDWLKSVLYGEFADHQPLSAIVTQMLINFLPGVVIVTSARDATAIILRLARHPEKREDLMEWILLSACLIVIALPLAMAAGGALAAGVGAVVGGIAGSELGAALRAVMLLLLKETTRLVELILFLQKFIKGDILKFLRLVKFAKYEKALLLTLNKFSGKLIEMVKSLRLHLESLRYFDSVEDTIVKLIEWERRFYAVQEDALTHLPKALAELDAKLTRVLAQIWPKEVHAVPAGVAADKTAAALPAPQRVRDTPGKILAKVEDDVPISGPRPTNSATATTNARTGQVPTTQPKSSSKPPVKDTPDPIELHKGGANTKKQAVVQATSSPSNAELIGKRVADNAALRKSNKFSAAMSKVGVTDSHITNMWAKEAPLGFESPEQFKAFKSELNTALNNAGLHDAEVGLKGTSTTFYSENPGKPLGHHWDADPLNPGDYDLNISSQTMVEKLESVGISPSEKYGVFKTRDMEKNFPALNYFREKWETTLGREVNFVGYPNIPLRDQTEYILTTGK